MIVTRGGCGVSSSAGAGAGAAAEMVGRACAIRGADAPSRSDDAVVGRYGPDAAGSARRGDCCVDGRERQACFGRALPLSSAASGVAARGESAPVKANGNFPEGGGPAGGASGKRGEADSRAAATALPALLFNIIFVVLAGVAAARGPRVELSDTFDEVWTGAQVVVASHEAQVSAWRNCAHRRRRREGVEK